jgi:hypothetical protein
MNPKVYLAGVYGYLSSKWQQINHNWSGCSFLAFEKDFYETDNDPDFESSPESFDSDSSDLDTDKIKKLTRR